MDSDPLVTIDDDALAKLREIRQAQPEGDRLAVVIAITGVDGDRFKYNMALMRPEQAASDDVVVDGEVPVIIPAGDVDNLAGATLTVSEDPFKPGFQVDNPNSPSPRILADSASVDLAGPVEDQVRQVVDQVINPAIAAHGGLVAVASVEPPTVFIRFSGGCQGCAVASVTLSQGIEQTLRSLVPEITKVMDVTDHAAGTDPYYEQSKK